MSAGPNQGLPRNAQTSPHLNTWPPRPAPRILAAVARRYTHRSTCRAQLLYNHDIHTIYTHTSIISTLSIINTIISTLPTYTPPYLQIHTIYTHCCHSAATGCLEPGWWCTLVTSDPTHPANGNQTTTTSLSWSQHSDTQPAQVTLPHQHCSALEARPLVCSVCAASAGGCSLSAQVPGPGAVMTPAAAAATCPTLGLVTVHHPPRTTPSGPTQRRAV